MRRLVLKITSCAVLAILATIGVASCSSQGGNNPADNTGDAKPMPSTIDSWRRIHQWLAAKAPKIVGNLNQPATEAEIDAAEKAFRCTMPDQWRELYRVHNGMNYKSNTGSLFYGMEFMSLDEAMRNHRNSDAQGVEELVVEKADAGVRKGRLFNPRWIPFGVDGGGDTALCLDLDPAEGGSRGQIIFVDYTYETVILVANSLAQFLEAFANDLDREAYFLDEEALKDGDQFLNCIPEIDLLNWHKSPRWRHLDRKATP